MSYRNNFFLAAVMIAAPVFVAPVYAADDGYEKAAQAMASKDYGTAVSLLQNAVNVDPDSLRNASELRQAVIRQTMTAHPKTEGAVADFDNEISFFEKVVAAHPTSSNAYLNYGFAYVDKIPAAGAITQVILANTALTQFSKSIELKPTWIALYTRGNSYLYWPKVFGRASLGVADLEKAYAMQKADTKRSYHVRVFISLGDGYWKTEQMDKATAMWKEGLAAFPNSQPLKDRLARQGDDLATYINNVLDPNKRVDTDLRELWSVGQ